MILLQIHRASNIGERAPRRLRSLYLMSHSIRTALALLPLALLTAGCGSSSDTTLPTAPTPTVITETFEGNLTVNGATSYPFVVATPSTLTATLVTVAAGTDVVVGMSLGTWNGEDCTVVITNDAAVQGKTVVGVAQTAGNFCVRIFAPTTLAAPTGYQVTVTHQ
jgi:hypothetical protein